MMNIKKLADCLRVAHNSIRKEMLSIDTNLDDVKEANKNYDKEEMLDKALDVLESVENIVIAYTGETCCSEDDTAVSIDKVYEVLEIALFEIKTITDIGFKCKERKLRHRSAYYNLLMPLLLDAEDIVEEYIRK